MRTIAFLVLLAGCGGGDVGGDDGGTPVFSGDAICLDAARDPSPICAIEPSGSTCELASNNDCGVVRLVEVWDAAENGPCLTVEIENVCDDVLYSVTCIEHVDEGETQWQCWWSTTWPGFDISVGQCGATGVYRRWHTLRDGELDVISESCQP